MVLAAIDTMDCRCDGSGAGIRRDNLFGWAGQKVPIEGGKPVGRVTACPHTAPASRAALCSAGSVRLGEWHITTVVYIHTHFRNALRCISGDKDSIRCGS